MAYNQQQGGYGQYSSYGQGGNPYGQQQQSNPYEQPYGHTGNYSERPELEHHSSSRYDEESAQGGNYEMTSMNNRDPNRILNEVRNLARALNDLGGQVHRLRSVQKRYLDDIDASESSPLRYEVNTQTDAIMAQYRNLVSRARAIKSDPESGNPRNSAQVGKIDRDVQDALNLFKRADHEFKRETKEQILRQIRIARPDVSDAEAEEIAQNSNGQVFSETMMAANRRGDAQRVNAKVKTRHEDITKIERDLAEIAQLSIDLEAAVVQQEPAVTQIEEKGEQATRHVAQANTELDGAVTKAKSARRKKWMCLGIALLIIIIIVVVVVVVVEVTKK